jgi:hypothetical protein
MSPARRFLWLIMLTLIKTAAASSATTAPLPAAPLHTAITALVPFATAPFPYRGRIPDSKQRFLDHVDNYRAGRTSERSGSIHWQDEVYHDRRVLLYLPRGFDIRKKALIVIFFHGNNATLERDVLDRQQVAAQLAAAGINAVLVAPQFAVDAPDSSAGRFWQRGHFSRFLDEAGQKLAAQYHNVQLADAFQRVKVVLIAYSGGYLPAAWALAVGRANARLQGVVLLDALYGDEEKFANWIKRYHHSAFFISAYTDSMRDENEAFREQIEKMHLHYQTFMPERLLPSNIVFVNASDSNHDDFVTNAWVANPIKDVLMRIADYPRGL